MITSPPKRGMALVVVLVLLAVMMLVTITLSGRMQQQLGRTRSQQEYQQALWYSASAESLALSALSLSLKNEKRVHLAQPWASGPRFFPLPQGQIAVTQSVILEALFDPWLSPVQARALLQQRPAKGWEDVDQFLAQPLLADVDERTKKQLKTVLSVDSNYFWLRSDITVNEIELTMNSLIVRMGPQHFSVLWHQTGESE